VKSGALWYCYVGGVGSASKWVRISSALKQVSPPFRSVPLTNHPGGQTKVYDLSSAIPIGSSAGLLSVQTVNTLGSGYMSLYSAALTTTTPTFSSLQLNKGQRGANEMTCAVDPTNSKIKLFANVTTDLLIDVVGYYP
jgi:hypothetical protein